MAVIHNEIDINSPREQVWAILSNLEALEIYDPIVTKSTLISELGSGVGAERHCETASGWFKEKVSVWNPSSDLEFSLYACNQPMKDLTHSYRLEERDGVTRVSQVMRYTMKFGLLGTVMDALVGRRTADKQIKLFMRGLKRYAETGKSKEDA